MASLLGYKCPNCGGNIKFNAAGQRFQCESCDSVFTQEQLSQYDDAVKETAEQPQESSYEYEWHSAGDSGALEGMNAYSCQSCGAQIVADDTTSASECPYCGSPVIMTGQLTGMNRPDCVIPFKLDERGALDALRNFAKGKRLLPSSFASENKVKEMKGVYVPFWLFDCGVSADITYDARRSRSWSDSNYRYVETSHFLVYRSGGIAFSDIPADGSSKMDDTYMEGIEPYNYADMTDFDPAYLSGFLADKYDVSADDSFPRVQERVANSTSDAFRRTVVGFDTVTPKSTSIRTKNGVYRYALMPVWMLNSKFGDRMYTYAINGQTGRVAGELPVDRKKFWLWFAGVAAAVIAVGQIFLFL